jgi:hypothetical protein
MPRSIVLVLGTVLWTAVACIVIAYATTGQWGKDLVLLVGFLIATAAVLVRDMRQARRHAAT